MLNKDRQYSRAGALIVILLSCPGPSVAQTKGPLASGFDELFPHQSRAAPIFTRPDTIARLPWLPRSADESAPPASAEAQGDSELGTAKTKEPAGGAREPPAMTADVIEIRIQSSPDGSNVWFD